MTQSPHKIHVSQSSENLYEIAMELMELGHYVHASEVFLEFLHRHPHSFEGWYYLGICYFRLGKTENARLSIRKAFSLDKTHVLRVQELNHKCVDEDSYTEAESCLRNELQQTPQDAAVWNTLGILFLEQERFDEAKQCFSNAVMLDPKYRQARFNLGRVELRIYAQNTCQL